MQYIPPEFNVLGGFVRAANGFNVRATRRHVRPESYLPRSGPKIVAIFCSGVSIPIELNHGAIFHGSRPPCPLPSRYLVQNLQHCTDSWKTFATSLMKTGVDRRYDQTSRRLRGPLCGHIHSLEGWKRRGPISGTVGTWRRRWLAMKRRRLCAWGHARMRSRPTRVLFQSLEILKQTGTV